jgi:hypothetical protein
LALAIGGVGWAVLVVPLEQGSAALGWRQLDRPTRHRSCVNDFATYMNVSNEIFPMLQFKVSFKQNRASC